MLRRGRWSKRLRKRLIGREKLRTRSRRLKGSSNKHKLKHREFASKKSRELRRRLRRLKLKPRRPSLLTKLRLKLTARGLRIS